MTLYLHSPRDGDSFLKHKSTCLFAVQAFAHTNNSECLAAIIFHPRNGLNIYSEVFVNQPCEHRM